MRAVKDFVWGVLTLLERFNDQGKVHEGDEHHIKLFESRENASKALSITATAVQSRCAACTSRSYSDALSGLLLGVYIHCELPGFVGLIGMIHEQMEWPQRFAQLAQ
jgi:hypothetical protein